MTVESQWWEDLTPPDDYDPNHPKDYHWKSERKAITYHICHICRKDICPSEFYQHIAIPLHTSIPYYDYCQEHYQP